MASESSHACDVWLIFGHAGWIGQQLKQHIAHAFPDDKIVCAMSRADNPAAVESEIQLEQPSIVVSCIGRTHGPTCNTIDYLEQNGMIMDNIRDNLFGPYVLASMCSKYGAHFAYIGTGCIFEYLDDQYQGRLFTESDEPNFFGSSYSVVKGFTDRIFNMSPLRNSVLNWRVRMPIIGTHHPRNFITKITKYDRVINIPNSMTVLPTMLPLMVDTAKRRVCGALNMTNPGAISHNEVLDMYRELVDPTFEYKNFTVEEQDEILQAQRSNNTLDTSRLEAMYPNVPPIRTAVRMCMQQMAESLKSHQPAQ